MSRAFNPLDPGQAVNLGKGRVVGNHLLAKRDWSDAQLAKLIDAYPREKLGVFLTADDPCDPKSWRRGRAGSLSGAELVKRVHEGRIWLNMRESNLHLPELAAIEADIVADMKRDAPALNTFKRDLGLLISSPRAQVLYHFDVAMVALFHLRGQKRFYLYPTSAPHLTQQMVEKAVLRETHEMLQFDPMFDRGAEVLDLLPGQFVSWPQNAPHRIVNGGDLNVSVSMEFMTPRAVLRANQHYANGVLRRNGHDPMLAGDYTPLGLGKAMLARAMKAAKPKPKSEPWTPQFDLSVAG
jgi:hypothetical protein